MMVTTDERLAEIRTYLSYPEVRHDEAMEMLGRLVPPLLAEYAAAMAIVRAVASVPDENYDEMCVFCREQPGYTNIKHTPDCPVTQARALLAQKEAQ